MFKDVNKLTKIAFKPFVAFLLAKEEGWIFSLFLIEYFVFLSGIIHVFFNIFLFFRLEIKDRV